MDLGTITLGQVLSIIKDAGTLGILILIVVGGYKRWWVYGYIYEEMVRDRDEWKQIALSGTEVAKKIANIAEKKD